MSIQTGANISKAAGYAVIATPAGANISKAAGYAVLSTEDRMGISKGISYGVLTPPKGVSVSAANVYVVLAPLIPVVQPQPGNIPVSGSNIKSQLVSEIYHYMGQDLILGPNGDLAQVSGQERINQRIIRRLLTNPDTYLFAQYGAGIGRFVGQTTAQEGAIRALIMAEMGKETEVSLQPPPVIQFQKQNDILICTIGYTNAVTKQAQTLTFPVGS